MAAWSHVPTADGPSQDDRLPAALRDGYFRVDEMASEQLLAIAVEFAAKLRFFDLGDQPLDRYAWSNVLMSDPAFVMALISAKDPRLLRAEFDEVEGLEAAVELALHAARTIDFWLRALRPSSSRPASELAERITVLIREKLRGPLQDIDAVARRLSEPGGAVPSRPRAGLDLSGLDEAWGGDGGSGVSEDGEDAAMHVVGRAFTSFLNGIVHLRQLARPYLDESLAESSHDPAAGLFLAFVDQLNRVRERLNGFTRRHLDFYYRDVLGATAQADRPDHVFLQVQPSGPAARVPRGSRFLPDVAGGAPPVYATDTELVAEPVEVAAVARLDLDRHPDISPECALGFVARLRSRFAELRRADLAAASGEDASILDVPAASPFASGSTGLGFAIASPLLFLREGQRRVTVSIELRLEPEGAAEEDGRAPVGAGLERAAESLSRVCTEPADDEDEAARLTQLRDAFGRFFRHYILANADDATSSTELEGLRKRLRAEIGRAFSPEDVGALTALLDRERPGLFQRLLRTAFAIELSGEDGWFAVQSFTLSPGAAGTEASRPGLTFELTLGPSAPPIVAPDPTLHGPGWEGEAPVVRFTLRAAEGLCGYSLFAESVLERVSLSAHVEGVRSLVAYSGFGRVDPSKPFQPFGPLPTRGSTLTVGSFEAARKQTRRVTLQLRWADLPAARGGFEAHYSGYGQSGPRASDFGVDVSYLTHGEFRALDRRMGGALPLFAEAGPLDRMPQDAVLGFDLPRDVRPLDPATPEAAFDSALDPRSGFFRLALTGPEGAFGHRAYPLLLARSLASNLRARRPKPAPREPYTPRIERLRLGYEAVADVSFEGVSSGGRRADVVLHFTPFGSREVRPSDRPSMRSLIPSFPSDSNLFIGLRGDPSAEGGVSLFFQPLPVPQRRVASAPRALRWDYLGPHGWRRIASDRVLGDSTGGFAQRGIVRLLVPNDADRARPEMPEGLVWLRVGTGDPRASFPRFSRIVANAVRATRQPGAAGETEARFSVADRWRAESLVPGLRAVSQCGSSSRGRPAETELEVRARISERVRHKHRAVSPWDYERLVLQEFPDVYKVKCFPATDASRPVAAPGHVLLAVVPRAPAPATPAAEPMLDSPELRRIQDFVRSLAPPYVRIQVRNPTYDRIQVRCAVELASGVERHLAARRLAQALVRYLDPFVPGGRSLCFGWTIRCEEVESFIRDLDDVVSVTALSLLRVQQDDDGSFRLGDTAARRTAAGEGPAATRGGDDADREALQPSVPWSIGVPMARHAIRVLEPWHEEPARASGVGDLAVGSTFIVPEGPDPAAGSPAQRVE